MSDWKLDRNIRPDSDLIRCRVTARLTFGSLLQRSECCASLRGDYASDDRRRSSEALEPSQPLATGVGNS